ncbi:riboflavin kinase [Patescibacteria group bacterium]
MFDLNGKVEKGIGLGGKLGYPTLNILLDKPSNERGVFVCEINLNEHIYKGVMHLGPKSFGTDDSKKIFCEVHVFDFNKDIESGQVYIKVLKKIRDVREFESTDELVAQISQDINIAKKHFKDA